MKPLYHYKIGSGNPLLAIPGGPGLGHSYFLPHLDKLGEFCSAIFYDQRGCGKSMDTLPPNPLEGYIQDIQNIRTKYEDDKLDILAHSWGGFLGAQYAVRYPERVNRLIFLDSVPLSMSDYQEYVTQRAKRLGTYNERLSELESLPKFSAGDPKIIKQYYQILFESYFYNQEDAKKLHFEYNKESAKASFAVYHLFIDHVMNQPFDLYDKLLPLKEQILIIHGDADPIPLHYIRKIPHSRLEIIKRCGHFPFIEQPEKFFDLLNSFMLNHK